MESLFVIDINSGCFDWLLYFYETREYIYLGNQPIGAFQAPKSKLPFSYDKQGKLTGVGCFPSTKEKPNELLQIHTDHLGTPRAVTDKTKAVLWRWEGDQFGTSSPQIEKIKLPLRHAGQYKDDESGLFYNWHRYYVPELGRYNRVDDLG